MPNGTVSFETHADKVKSCANRCQSNTQGDVLDECLQLHGGYGFMQEYAIGEMWTDARVQRIYGGTNEIMKELISRSL